MLQDLPGSRLRRLLAGVGGMPDRELDTVDPHVWHGALAGLEAPKVSYLRFEKENAIEELSLAAIILSGSESYAGNHIGVR